MFAKLGAIRLYPDCLEEYLSFMSHAMNFSHQDAQKYFDKSSEII